MRNIEGILSGQQKRCAALHLAARLCLNVVCVQLAAMPFLKMGLRPSGDSAEVCGPASLSRRWSDCRVTRPPAAQLLLPAAPDETLPVYYVFTLWSLFIADICSQPWEIVLRQLSFYATAVQECSDISFGWLLKLAKKTPGVLAEPEFEWPVTLVHGVESVESVALGPVLNPTVRGLLLAEQLESLKCQMRKLLREQGYIMYSLISHMTALLNARTDSQRLDVLHHIFGREINVSLGSWEAKPKYSGLDGYTLQQEAPNIVTSRLCVETRAADSVCLVNIVDCTDDDAWYQPGAPMNKVLAGFKGVFGQTALVRDLPLLCMTGRQFDAVCLCVCGVAPDSRRTGGTRTCAAKRTLKSNLKRKGSMCHARYRCSVCTSKHCLSLTAAARYRSVASHLNMHYQARTSLHRAEHYPSVPFTAHAPALQHLNSIVVDNMVLLRTITAPDHD